MKKWNPSLLLSSWLVGIAGVRFLLAISYPTYMGIDGGAYLQDVLRFWYHVSPVAESVHFARPPLAPGYLMVPFLWAFGITPLAYNLYAAFGSLLIFPFYYLLARRILGPAWGAFAVVALSLDWNQWIMFVTGVVPVLGFGGICLALWAMLGIAEENHLWHRLGLIGAIPLIALSNQTSAGLALVSLSLAWLVLPHKMRVGCWLAFSGLIAMMTAWPWYREVLPGNPQVAYPGPLFYLPPWIEYIWWQAPLLLAGAGAVWYATRRRLQDLQTPSRGLRVLCIVVIVHTLLSLVNSSDEAVMNILFRSGIWVTIPFWIILVWLVSQLRLPRLSMIGVIGCTMALAALGAGYLYQRQFFYSAYYSADVKAAVESLDMSTVTRLGTNAESRGFWLAALTGKPVVWIQPAPPSPRYVEAEHRARCELGWLPNCATGYVSHWVIDKTQRQTWAPVITRAPNPIAPWSQIGRDAPWLRLIWRRGQVEVWEYVPIANSTFWGYRVPN